METYTELKDFVENQNYAPQRQKSLDSLADDIIEEPIIGIVKKFNLLPCCFTLQSCFGHFIFKNKKYPNNHELLPIKDTTTKVKYRIAYIAFCIENSVSGIKLFKDLKKITDIDPENIQFFCAEWFWNRQVNSFVLQVEPYEFRRLDKACLDYEEALYIEKIRNEFFIKLDKVLENAIKTSN